MIIQMNMKNFLQTNRKQLEKNILVAQLAFAGRDESTDAIVSDSSCLRAPGIAPLHVHSYGASSKVILCLRHSLLLFFASIKDYSTCYWVAVTLLQTLKRLIQLFSSYLNELCNREDWHKYARCVTLVHTRIFASFTHTHRQRVKKDGASAQESLRGHEC